MISLTVAIAIISALGVEAIPAPVKINSAGHTVHQVRNPNYTRNGPAQLAKTYRKYGKPVPQHIQAAADRTHKINIAATGQDGGDGDGGSHPVGSKPDPDQSEWLTPVSIGGTTFHLDFDTGSSDLWVFGTDAADGRASYTCPSGKTADGETWSISYGDGSGANGDVCMGAVTIGDYTVQNQAIEIASTQNGFDKDRFPGDGLLGLAFSNINTVSPDPQKVWVENAIANKDWTEAGTFTADLRPDGGSYTFGKCTAKSPTWVAIDQVGGDNGFWQWGGTSGAIADTGTTLLLIDDSEVSTYYKKNKQLKATNSNTYGGWVFPCANAQYLSPWSKSIKSYKLTVPGSAMNFGAVDKDHKDTCYGGMQSNAGLGLSIYGDTVLKTVALCHDYVGKRLGWGAKP